MKRENAGVEARRCGAKSDVEERERKSHEDGGREGVLS